MASHPAFDKHTTSEQVVDAFAQEIRGKTVLITGVSPNGLGEALAHAIASKSPSLLILTARSTTKAHAVAKKLEDDYPSVDVRVLQLDLSSQRSVRQAATELDNLTQTIDVLINNAGVMGLSERTLSQDGVEMQFATNYLGHFLFTNLLMGKMVASAAQRPAGQTRIVNITSAGHVLTPVRFSDYNYEGKAVPPEEQPDVVIAAKMGMPDLDPRSGYLPLFAYAQSNTANMLFTVQLADSLQEKGICSFSAAPGVVETELQRHMPKGFRNPYMFYKTPSQGAATFLVAAFDPSLTGSTGAFLDDCHVATPAEHAMDKKMATRLWNLGEELIGQRFDLDAR